VQLLVEKEEVSEDESAYYRAVDLSEILLVISGYNDIFSYFDPRPYSEKALSIDFLSEVKRASIDKDAEGISIRFLMPDRKRSRSEEEVIQKRLRAHFNRHFDSLKSEYDLFVRKGLLFIIFGIIIMFLATFIIFQYHETEIFTTFLVVLLEPGGWFLFWEGLNMVLFEPKKLRPDLNFYHKMSRCKISFFSK
jgi:hypothetical protein